jgi:vitamin B12 transporter
MKRFIMPISMFLSAVAVLFTSCPYGYAQSAKEKSFLSMYFTDEELEVVSATRSLTSISRVAENITVVTASEIELMNAHTLADVLNTVTGVQVESGGGPGQVSVGHIQGSDTNHVTVLIDGVALNNLSDTVVDLTMVPVQMIDKIEIIKGPASSAWGSALGGVVNVITKQGNPRNSGGVLSASYGKRNTGDFRAETRGKQERFGWYLTAGRLQSNGLTLPHYGVSDNNAYTKMSYDLTDNTTILFTLGLVDKTIGQGEDPTTDPPFSEDFVDKLTHSTLAINSQLNKDIEINISVRTLHDEFTNRFNQSNTGEVLLNDKSTSKGYGSSAKLTWKIGMNAVVVGADYDDKKLAAASAADHELSLIKSAVYANDTLSLGALSITPGIRFDRTNTNGNATSPSLGVAYQLGADTILRAYAANGFNIPPLAATYGSISSATIPNPDLKVESVRSYQIGAETALKFMWIKLSLFRNDIRDSFGIAALADGSQQFVNLGKSRRQGFEFEIKTAPVFNTSLTAGADFIDAKDLVSGERILNVPLQVYDYGLVYNDEQSWKARLAGRYINWNAEPRFQAKDNAPLFDLNVIKKIWRHGDASLDAFVNMHNIFNSNQYFKFVYPNPERWFEGGLRYTF